MKTLHFIAILFICGCQNANKHKDNNILTDSSYVLTFNEKISISNKDSLTLQTSRHKSAFTQFSDSSNSFCQLFGDTLKFFLSTGRFEGSYTLTIQLFNDTFVSSFNLFDNYSKYIYSPISVQVTLDKNKFKANDYVIAQVTYKAIGKLQNSKEPINDSAFFSGKIRLKIRDSKFTFEDFNIENQRNDFYALLNQHPDTIKNLNLYGCAFKDLPPELSKFAKLEELDLEGNDLSNSNFQALSDLSKLKSLSLQDCNLSVFPLAILKLKNLEILTLYANKLTSIPDDLYNLTSLKDLTIGKNKLNYLSPKISRLKNLESFESSSTEIKSYPNEMVILKKLVEIYPNDTMIYIPKSLRKYLFGCDTILTK